jgi:hypothetical protein
LVAVDEEEDEWRHGANAGLRHKDMPQAEISFTLIYGLGHDEEADTISETP